jgi:Vitamin K-dependent gamma-carboxylase
VQEERALKKKRRPAPPPPSPILRAGLTRPAPIFSLFGRWLEEAQPILRVEIVRIAAPLAVLGFMSGRIAHADEWLSDGGFQVPDLGGDDWRQPFYMSPLSPTTAWILVAVMVLSGLSLAAGFRSRLSALIFAVCLGYVALADRLAAFTVSKMSPVVMLALACSPCGARFGVDAFLKRRSNPATPLPTHAAGGTTRFYQALLSVMYCTSGIWKARGDWLSHPLVLWTHVHDSYQTAFSWALANVVPSWLWTVLQAVTLLFELFAPLWFIVNKTRPWALAWGVGMHVFIGLIFGPVRWFALLMITLLVASFWPEEQLERAAKRLPF